MMMIIIIIIYYYLMVVMLICINCVILLLRLPINPYRLYRWWHSKFHFQVFSSLCNDWEVISYSYPGRFQHSTPCSDTNESLQDLLNTIVQEDLHEVDADDVESVVSSEPSEMFSNVPRFNDAAWKQTWYYSRLFMTIWYNMAMHRSVEPTWVLTHTE